eukprot:GHVT01101103.1.p1 GENE.GHVT01101103.1~~GHVT01101103.1.p1  ORF type:complete len:154 (+),score=29.93 GHVT01101103.1:293-754(+)
MFFPSANEKFGAARSEGEGFGSVPGAGGRDRRNNSQENGPLHRKMAMKLFLFLMFIFLAVAPSSSNHIFVALTPAGEILFFQHRDGPWVPNLRLLHKCTRWRHGEGKKGRVVVAQGEGRGEEEKRGERRQKKNRKKRADHVSILKSSLFYLEL